MPKKIVIIGAGLGGLAAGCYARMNGFETDIYEMHTKPGGLCTSWQRKGYTIDYAIHDLSGPNKNSALHFLWEELGALVDTPMHYSQEFWRVETPDGVQVPMYRDIEKLGDELKKIAPEDAALIDTYLKDVRKFGKVEFMGVLSGKISSFLGMLHVMGAMRKWGGVTMREFAERFSNPNLQSAFAYFQYGWPDIPVMIHMAFAGMSHQGLFGYPEGGSLAFSKNIASRFESLGGTLHFGKAVKCILTENERAVGLELADGSRIEADYVISNADGYTTIYQMLEGRYVDESIKQYYSEIHDEQEMNTTISLGVAREFPKEWRAITFLLEDPIEIAGELRENIDVEFFGDEYGFSPKGKSVLKILMKTKYSYWKGLRSDPTAYNTAKSEAISKVVKFLAKRFPGLENQIEMQDMATPITVERYTGCIQGNQAWSPPNFSLMMMMKGFTHRLPGLDHFYLAGQWALASVGIPNAASDGRKVIKMICREEKQRFKTTKVRG